MTSAEAVSAPQERGWWLLLFALGAFVLFPRLPQLRVAVPIEETLLLLVPAIAICTLIAWWYGGRGWLAVAWTILAVWILWRPVPGSWEYDSMARGWVLVVCAVFGVVNLVSTSQPFFARALSTVAFSLLFSVAVLVVSNVTPSRVQRTLGDELARRLAPTATTNEVRSNPGWLDRLESQPAVVRMTEAANQRGSDIASRALPLFPALLALESLAALSLGWQLFHRVSRTRIGPPLAPLRRFRVNEELIWGLLAGGVIVLVPSLKPMRGLGLNLAFFFGTLYALRGAGVLAWAIAPRALAVVLFAVLAYVFWPQVALIAFLAAIGLGLVDNWMDWRRPARQAT